MIEIKDLSKSFSPKFPPVLEEINATLKPGQIVGLIGPDGAGKTTLIRLMATLLLPTKGSIAINGLDTKHQADEIHQILGYMPQKFGLYDDLSVMQNLNLYAKLKGLEGKEKGPTFERLMHFTNLGPFTNRLARNLSGGMKQKLGLACALLKKPKILLLDEPSVGVDPISRRELWQMTQELLHEEIAIVWSSAYLDEAEKCDSVILLNEGKMLFHGSPNEFRGDRSFEEAFVERLGGYEEKPSKLAEHRSKVDSGKGVVIEAKDLVKEFNSFTAVNHLNCQIKRGTIFGLLGPNGAGKSTTFRMFCGLLPPTSGTTSVLGLSFDQAPSEIRSHIGYMAQKFSLYGNLSVMQNLEFYAGVYGIKEREKRIEAMLEIFDLKKYESELADTLPLGYKQRLSLICATMHEPEIIFLDEPTSGVDPITRKEFWNHIKGLVAKGVTIMITTHYMDEAEFCDEIALIYKGNIIQGGSPRDLKNLSKSQSCPNPTLEDTFIHLIEEYDAQASK